MSGDSTSAYFIFSRPSNIRIPGAAESYLGGTQLSITWPSLLAAADEVGPEAATCESSSQSQGGQLIAWVLLPLGLDLCLGPGLSLVGPEAASCGSSSPMGAALTGTDCPTPESRAGGQQSYRGERVNHSHQRGQAASALSDAVNH